MSDETPTIEQDLDTLAAFFGEPEGPPWQLGNGDPFDAYALMARLRAEVERLTRERDDERHMKGVYDSDRRVQFERAETAERERDAARRALIRSCFGSAEYADIRKPGDADGIRARSHEEAAEYWGWDYLYPDDCPECPGEGGRHAMSCSRGGNKGQIVVSVTDARGDDGCLHCDAPVVAPSEQACEHPKCKDGFIETWAGEGPPIRTRCPRCARARAGAIRS